MLGLVLGRTFTAILRNYSSEYLWRKTFLNLLCNGLLSLPISLHVQNTLADFIVKSYDFFCWSTLTWPDSRKFNNFSNQTLEAFSISSIKMIDGLFCSKTSKILLV